MGDAVDLGSDSGFVSHYRTLGVSEHASQAAIREAYRKAVQRCHPDRFQGQPEAEAAFKEITIAYKALRDPKSRREYDRQVGIAPDGPHWAENAEPEPESDRVSPAELARLETLAALQAARSFGAARIASRLIAEGAPYSIAWHLAWRARRGFLARALEQHAHDGQTPLALEGARDTWQEARDRHRSPLRALLGRMIRSER